MRVLFVSCDPLEGAVTRYRCTHLAEALKSAGHTAAVATIYDPVIRLEHEIVVLHRICANEEGQALADAVRKSGATLLYGADDLVFEEGLHLAMLRQADGVLVSTNALAEFAREAGAKDVAVVRNVANAMERPLLAFTDLHSKPGVKILYPSGTRTHDADIASIGSVLSRCLKRFPDVSLYLAGPVEIPDVLKEQSDRIERYPLMEWESYIAAVNHFAITLAPLEPTRFNQGKSELKWQEAAICEKPTLASRWGGFAEVVQEGEDGLLADSLAEWEEKLALLLSDPELRYRLGSSAFARLRTLHERQPESVQMALAPWADSGPIRSVTFTNPRGFVKGKVKSVLRKVRG